MTKEDREKAIQVFEDMKRGINPWYPEEYYDMAIEALSAEPTTKNDLGVDCISRTQAQTEIEMNAARYTIAKERGGMGQVEWSDQLIKVSDAADIIRNLPPVTEFADRCRECGSMLGKQKMGRWIKVSPMTKPYCSECGKSCIGMHGFDYVATDFCPHCGAKMEREDKNE